MKLRAYLVLPFLVAIAFGEVVWSEEPAVAVKPTPDAYVDDSFEAGELLGRMRLLAEQGQWLQASRLADALFAEHGARLVRGDGGGYSSVAKRVGNLLADWPENGIRVYRGAFERRAKDAYKAALHARDVDALADVMDRYFVTSAAAAVADAMSELCMESGRFAEAERVCERIIASHPDRDRLKPAFVARLAILAAAAGREREAQERLAEYERILSGVPITWSGHQLPLATVVDAVLSDVRALGHGADDARWPCFAGSPARNRPGEFVIDRLALLWRFDKFAPGTLAGAADDGETGATHDIREAGKLLMLHPVADASRLYFQDADDIWGIDRTAGTQVWHYSVGSSASGRDGGSDGATAQWYAPTVFRDRLYACTGFETVPYYGYEAALRTTAAVCLDAATGRLIWRTDPSAMGVDREKVGFGSSPLVTVDGVFVLARRRRTFGFEDCYLVRLDTDDGHVVFQTHLGSGSVGGFGYRQATLSLPALDGGVVYVCSNLGTVAAVSARTGRVEWLTPYSRRSETDRRALMRSSELDVAPWHINPVVVAGQRVICRPLDASPLMIVDRRDGHILHTLDETKVGRVQTILGTDERSLYLLVEVNESSRVVGVDLASAEIAWQADLPDDARVLGRGVLSGDAVLLPTSVGLCAFDARNGSRTMEAWPEESSGNLLAMRGQLVVAGNDHVSAYGRKVEVWDRLRHAMADRPDDPAPALELSEIAFRSGRRAEGFDLLLDAAVRFDRFRERDTPVTMQRLFTDCMWYASEWVVQNDEDRTRVRTLYERAAGFAPDTAAHVAYRLRFADFLISAGDPSRAVDLCQQILSDRSLRDQPWQPESDGNTAEQAARRRIDSIIERYGRSVYAAYDMEAREWFEAARQSGNTELLDRLLRTRPLATVVSEAMALKSRLLGERGDHWAAVRLLADVLHRSPQAADAPEHIRRIADLCALAGRDDKAHRWMSKAVHAYPRARFAIGDRRVSASEYRDRFKISEQRRHRLTPNLRHTFERFFDFDAELMSPLFGTDRATDPQNVYVYGDDAVHAFSARTGDARWPTAASCSKRPTLLWADTETVVLGTHYEVMGLNASDGTRKWSAGGRPVEADDASVDPESVTNIYSHALDGDRLFIITDDGQAACVDIATGRLHWRAAFEHKPQGPAVMSDRWIAYPTRSFKRPAVFVANAEDGRGGRLIVSDVDETILASHVSADGLLLVVSAQSVAAYELETGLELWRKRIGGSIVKATVAVDIDAVYLSDDGSRISKFSKYNGSRLWRSEPLFTVGMHDAELRLVDERVLVLSEKGFIAIDPVDGRTMWETDVDSNVSLYRRFTTDRYVVAVDAPSIEHDGPYRAIFFDLQGTGAIVPPSPIDLGPLRDVRRVLVRDGAMIVQTGRNLFGWSDDQD